MKIALLGKGKTGSKVVEVANEKKYSITIFDSKNHPTLEALQGHDVIISFLTGEIFSEYIPMLISTGIPVVTGSTGFTWDKKHEEEITRNNLKWIHSNNFSLGMNIVKNMIEALSIGANLFDEVKFNIHEVHHTKKLDAPSGTAKSWANWLNRDCDITSERTGDVIGYHEITFDNGVEKIKLSHDALDRKIFAAGAIWSSEKINNLSPGLHHFSSVVKQFLENYKTN